MRHELPAGWSIDDRAVKVVGAGIGLDVRTGTAPTGYQLVSPPLRLAEGTYAVVIEGAVRSGGVLIGVQDVAAQKWIATSYYRDGQAFDSGGRMAVIFTLSYTTSLNVILANSRPSTGSSEWHLERIEVGELRERALVGARASLVDTKPEIRDLLPRARAAIAGVSSDWQRAERVRDMVRAELARGVSPVEVADAFWQVGSQLGLPLRVVHSSANGVNASDSFATVEVWLDAEERSGDL